MPEFNTKITDLRAGTGAECKAGDTVSVHYTGTLDDGLDGLSMFLVRAFRDGADGRRERLVTIDRLEEKMGQHASATAALRFDRAPAELVGQPGDGFRQMLELINHARIGVGFES